MNKFCQSRQSFRGFQRFIDHNARKRTPSLFSLNQISCSLHTKSATDKYGRRVVRRVIRNSVQTKKTKRSKKWPKMQKIPTPQNILPRPIQPPPDLKPLISPGAALVPKAARKKARRKFKQWLKDNAGIIILNFGSIASFLSFTRTDILELRLLSITGSLSSIVYFASRPPPLVLGPVIWSSVFALTNTYMVYYIYEERKGKPKQMTVEEENVYEEHFLPHAVTPRQFEKLLAIAKKRELSRGDVLIQKGEEYNKVYLVISGSTEAVTTMSRRVTAASSSKGNKERFAAGDAGAWVGELGFLDYLSEIDKRRSGALRSSPPPLSEKSPSRKEPQTLSTAPSDNAPAVQKQEPQNSGTRATKNSILTYIATKDSILYEWDYGDLADLMKQSADLRSSVTRAMTAAVVGKVINLYVSKADAGKPIWKKWIEDNWQSSSPVSSAVAPRENISGVRVKVVEE